MLQGPSSGQMRYLHTMVRVRDLNESLDFYCTKLGLEEIRRVDSPTGRFTLVFLAAPGDRTRAEAERTPLLELTYNWDKEDYGSARNFGHLAFEVDDIYAFCQRLGEAGITINRPPRDGHMAFTLTRQYFHRNPAKRVSAPAARALGFNAQRWDMVSWNFHWRSPRKKPGCVSRA